MDKCVCVRPAEKGRERFNSPYRWMTQARCCWHICPHRWLLVSLQEPEGRRMSDCSCTYCRWDTCKIYTCNHSILSFVREPARVSTAKTLIKSKQPSSSFNVTDKTGLFPLWWRLIHPSIHSAIHRGKIHFSKSEKLQCASWSSYCVTMAINSISSQYVGLWRGFAWQQHLGLLLGSKNCISVEWNLTLMLQVRVLFCLITAGRRPKNKNLLTTSSTSLNNTYTAVKPVVRWCLTGHFF